MLVDVLVGVAVSVGVAVCVGVSVGVAVAVGVAVFVGVAVSVGVGVGGGVEDTDPNGPTTTAMEFPSGLLSCMVVMPNSALDPRPMARNLSVASVPLPDGPSAPVPVVTQPKRRGSVEKSEAGQKTGRPVEPRDGVCWTRTNATKPPWLYGKMRSKAPGCATPAMLTSTVNSSPGCTANVDGTRLLVAMPDGVGDAVGVANGVGVAVAHGTVHGFTTALPSMRKAMGIC